MMPGIIRNKLKINAAVQNAKAFLEIQKEFGSFDKYIWQFVNGKPKINSFKSLKEVPAKTIGIRRNEQSVEKERI